jgi:hypothetical protein
METEGRRGFVPVHAVSVFDLFNHHTIRSCATDTPDRSRLTHSACASSPVV